MRSLAERCRGRAMGSRGGCCSRRARGRGAAHLVHTRSRVNTRAPVRVLSAPPLPVRLPAPSSSAAREGGAKFKVVCARAQRDGGAQRRAFEKTLHHRFHLGGHRVLRRIRHLRFVALRFAARRRVFERCRRRRRRRRLLLASAGARCREFFAAAPAPAGAAATGGGGAGGGVPGAVAPVAQRRRRASMFRCGPVRLGQMESRRGRRWRPV